MMRLFGMECKKIAGSILYWVLVLALLAVTLFQYDPSVESELRSTNDPSSVFYTADNYAQERGAPDEVMEQNMMKEATKLLLYPYLQQKEERGADAWKPEIYSSSQVQTYGLT